MKLNIHLWREDSTSSTLDFTFEELEPPEGRDWGYFNEWRQTYVGPFLVGIVEMLEPGDHISLERVK